jgi:hypothetical protein
MTARSDVPGTPFGSHVEAVFQLALFVAVKVAAFTAAVPRINKRA